MIGSGAWACAAMHIVAQNCLAYDEADEFVDDVKMWVYEEDYKVGRGGRTWAMLHHQQQLSSTVACCSEQQWDRGILYQPGPCRPVLNVYDVTYEKNRIV